MNLKQLNFQFHGLFSRRCIRGTSADAGGLSDEAPVDAGGSSEEAPVLDSILDFFPSYLREITDEILQVVGCLVNFDDLFWI